MYGSYTSSLSELPLQFALLHDEFSFLLDVELQPENGGFFFLWGRGRGEAEGGGGGRVGGGTTNTRQTVLSHTGAFGSVAPAFGGFGGAGGALGGAAPGHLLPLSLRARRDISLNNLSSLK